MILICFFVWRFYTDKTNSVSQERTDTFSGLQIANKDFSIGVQKATNGDFAGALESFKKSKEVAKTDSQLAIIDFNIADSSFNIDRSVGINNFIQLSKNPTYPARTRGLAMIRAYLMYAKFHDQNLLKQIATENNIIWTTEKEVIYTYMNQIYNLYPFAFPAIYIVQGKLDSINDKSEAINTYNQYSAAIIKNISEMKLNSGEGTETTSSMLNHVILQSRLNIEFNALPIDQVEKSYEDLINYDQQTNNRSNKQYTLTAYANFESGIKNFSKAENVIKLLLAEDLHPALKESLPTMDIKTRYPYLLELRKNTTDKKIIDFIDYIGSKL
ncbi:MAG: hypothetical protein JWN37_11 [Candidatus Nomurabacteria bacterium]|nr:hypothetical protein [Candidatus Nomurabacteria bacterium]